MQNCVVCTRKGMWQSSQWWSGDQRWWRCRNCGEWQLEVPPQGLRIPPKVLYVDVETALMKVYVYDLYVPNKRISKDMIAQNSFVVTWSAAWLNADNTIRRQMSGTVTPQEARKQNDKRIIQEIHTLLDECDYAVTHNGDSFDTKVLNWRFLLYGLPFPEYKRLDTFKLAGKHTRPPSRGLEPLSLALGGNPKQGLDRAEWIEVVETGNPKLLAKAKRYCRGDVREGVNLYRHYAAAIETGGRQLYR